MKKINRLFIAIFAYSTFMLFGLFGQNSGALSGKVTAASGAPVPSASVLVTDSTGFSRNAVTGQDGSFTVSNLPPGTYKVDVQVPGFKRLTQENVQIAAGTPVNLKLGLDAGTEQESVAVQGQAALADDTSARIAHSYTGRVTSELPVQDLNYEQLVEMMPGVTPPMAPSATPAVSQSDVNPTATSPTTILVDPQSNRVWNTNGQPQQANNFLLDGVENQEAERNFEAHVASINSIQQLNLTTANYDASQGRVGGSLINPTTRAGANSFHGELFEYHSNDWFRARNYFDPSPLAQPVYTSNQFGAEISGPVIKNQMFLSLSDQEDMVKNSTSLFTTVPSAPFTTGNFSSLASVAIYNPYTGTANGAGRTAFLNNVIPASLLNPTAVALLGTLPAPNLGGLENNYFSNQQLINNGNRADARLDERFNDSNLLFLSYGLSYYDTNQASILGGLDQTGGSSRLRAQNGLIGYTHAFGPSTFTDVRAGFTRYSDPINQQASSYSGSAFGFAGNNGQLPNIAIDGILPLGTNPVYPQINREDNWNLVNNWSMRIHNNDLRFGVDYYQIRADGFQNLPYGPQGGYTFTPWATSSPGSSLGAFGSYPNSLASFLLGTPTVEGIDSYNYLPSYVSRQFSAYLSDRINIMSRLTLDLGLRYDYFQPVQPRSNNIDYELFQPATNSLALYGAGSGVNSIKSNSRNFSPHIGLAYRFNDRTALRAGYGINYWNPEIGFEASTILPVNGIAQVGVLASYGVAGTLGTFPVATTPLVGTASVAFNQPFYFSPRQVRTPYVQSWNFDIQRDVTHGMLIDLAFVGNVGRDLPYTQNLNAAAPGTGVAGEPYAYLGETAPIYERGTGFNSNYNSLQVNLTKRFSQGIAFTAAYTFSKSLDYGAGLTPFLNNVNPFANYGPSNFDQTNVLTITHNWMLPFGPGTHYFNHGVLAHILGPWEFDGILRYGSGLPYTPTGSAAICECPGNTPTANLAGSYAGGVVNSAYPGYYGLFSYLSPYQFGSLGFSQPAVGSFGDLGRNSVRGPSFTNYDAAISRSFMFGERARLQLRAEAYNVANSVHYGTPITNLNSSNFGLSTSTMPGLDNRLFQAVVKVTF